MKEENQSRLEININSQKTSLYFPPDSFLCFLVQEEAVKWVLGDRYFFCKTHLSNIDCNAVIAQLKMMYVDLWWFFLVHKVGCQHPSTNCLSGSTVRGKQRERQLSFIHLVLNRITRRRHMLRQRFHKAVLHPHVKEQCKAMHHLCLIYRY